MTSPVTFTTYIFFMHSISTFSSPFKRAVRKEIMMKIYAGSFTLKHKIKALKRTLKAFIFGKVTWSELTRVYAAMLHLERYLERLKSKKLKVALFS